MNDGIVMQIGVSPFFLKLRMVPQIDKLNLLLEGCMHSLGEKNLPLVKWFRHIFMFTVMNCMETSFFTDMFNHWKKKRKGKGGGKKGQPWLLKFVENIRKVTLHLKRAFGLFKIF